MIDSDTPAIVILPRADGLYEVCAANTLSQEAVAQQVSGRLGGVWRVMGEAIACSVEDDRRHWQVVEVK